MSIFPLLQPESPEAQAMYDLFIWVVLISLGVFIIVTGLIVIALWRGRSSTATPEQEFGRTKSEIFWMTGPILILIWIFVISAKLVLTMNARTENPSDRWGGGGRTDGDRPPMVVGNPVFRKPDCCC